MPSDDSPPRTIVWVTGWFVLFLAAVVAVAVNDAINNPGLWGLALAAVAAAIVVPYVVGRLLFRLGVITDAE